MCQYTSICTIEQLLSLKNYCSRVKKYHIKTTFVVPMLYLNFVSLYNKRTVIVATIQATIRKKANKSGHFPIVIRITENRKSTYVYTGQYIDLKHWDSKKRTIKKSHPNSTRLNNLIANKLATANRTLLDAASDSENSMNLSEIKKTISRKKGNNSFYIFAEEYFATLDKNHKHSRVNAENPLLNRIKKFHKNKELDFSDITPHFLRKFITHLRTQGIINERSIMNTLVFIRTLYNKAIAEGIVKRGLYPFGSGEEKIKIRFPESNKIGLSTEEIKKIEQLNLSNSTRLTHARNIWLFSFYFAGMRVADVFKTKWSDIKDNRLYYQMGKNNKTVTLKVHEKVHHILKYYLPIKGDKDDHIFPELKNSQTLNPKELLKLVKTSNKKINLALKQIAIMAEIEKPLTMHIARHTFGNISGDKIPIRMLQKLYRHSSITTTINYQANFTYKEEDKALDSVLDF